MLPQDAGQKQQFARGPDNSHTLELSGSDERLCGRVVYVIVKCGVQGLIYPIKTDVEQQGRAGLVDKWGLGCVIRN